MKQAKKTDFVRTLELARHHIGFETSELRWNRHILISYDLSVGNFSGSDYWMKSLFRETSTETQSSKWHWFPIFNLSNEHFLFGFTKRTRSNRKLKNYWRKFKKFDLWSKTSWQNYNDKCLARITWKKLIRYWDKILQCELSGFQYFFRSIYNSRFNPLQLSTSRNTTSIQSKTTQCVIQNDNVAGTGECETYGRIDNF